MTTKATKAKATANKTRTRKKKSQQAIGDLDAPDQVRGGTEPAGHDCADPESERSDQTAKNVIQSMRG